MRNSPASQPHAEVRLPQPQRLPEPERLAPSPEFRDRAANPGQRPAKAKASSTTLEIAVDGDGLALLGPDAGVATFQCHDGADFVWTPFPRDAAPSAMRKLVVQVQADQDVAVTVASEARFAKYGYVCRTDVPVARLASGQTLPVALTAFKVELLLPPEQSFAGPLQVGRIADPNWLLMRESAGVVLRRGTRSELVLGAGDYELSAPLTKLPAQRFTVPSSGPIVITNELATARAGRP
ncbi:MAG: hypothetical protein ACK501_01380 [Planctomycetota bacterium]